MKICLIMDIMVWQTDIIIQEGAGGGKGAKNKIKVNTEAGNQLKYNHCMHVFILFKAKFQVQK